MAAIKEIIAALIGILILASLVGYSGQEDIPNVPKPGAGFCGVTKESFDNIPGSGLLVDIEVDVSWDDSEVWIGIITVEDYDSLEKLGENSEGELVPCDSKLISLQADHHREAIRNSTTFQMVKSFTL